jgi:hypothetical protein
VLDDSAAASLPPNDSDGQVLSDDHADSHYVAFGIVDRKAIAVVLYEGPTVEPVTREAALQRAGVDFGQNPANIGRVVEKVALFTRERL